MVSFLPLFKHKVKDKGYKTTPSKKTAKARRRMQKQNRKSNR